MSKKVIIAGAGFSGMSLAAHLALKGFEVEVYEKHESPGGKVRQYINDGFTFDMGASIYFYPEIFERFFNKFNHTASDFYTLKKLTPSYRVFFNADDYFDIPTDKDKLLELCDDFEADGGKHMAIYLKLAKSYFLSFNEEFLSNNSLNYNKLLRSSWIKSALSGRNHQKVIRRLFSSYQIVSMLEFPIPFLGIVPSHSPTTPFAANYALLRNGLFYPDGGMHKVEEAISAVLEELKVPVHYSSEVKNFDIIGDSISGILTHQKNFHADLFASAMDYYHTEQLIGKDYRNYSNSIWKSESNCPSILIFYLGFNKKISRLKHHNLIFNDCFELPPKKAIRFNFNYKTCLSFITCTSKTETSKAPNGMENIVARISIPPGLEDTGKMREHYYSILISRLEDITGQSLKDDVIIKKSFAMNDYEQDYNSFRGNPFGALNAIKYPILWKPRIRNKHLSNLYYAELPNILGPGMASALLTGEMIASVMINDQNRKQK